MVGESTSRGGAGVPLEQYIVLGPFCLDLLTGRLWRGEQTTPQYIEALGQRGMPRV